MKGKEYWTKPAKKLISEYSERSVFQKFYQSKEWVKLSNYVKNSFPICQHCNKAYSYEVHHVHPLATEIGWNLRLSLYDDDYNQNLIAICKSCHSKETRKEQIETVRAEQQRRIDKRMKQLEIE